VLINDFTQVKDVRLPSHLTPEYYRVHLIPFIIPDNYTIKGTTDIILLGTQQAGRNISFHALNMNISSVRVFAVEGTVEAEEAKSGGRKVQVTGRKYDKDRQWEVVSLGEATEENVRYRVEVDFVAELADGLAGFYRSVYKDKDGKDV